jgi:thiamine biosynthesis lipoprotein
VTDAYVHTVALMGTVVTFHVVGHGSTETECEARAAGVENAVSWFRAIEAACSRFDPASELSRLCETSGVAVTASAHLLQAVQVALAIAGATDGAFDPTVGGRLAARGFDRDYRSGEPTPRGDIPDGATYRDVHVDPERGTITLARPLLLDLGAVAKGLAIDLAARELGRFENFVIDAGGDLYLAGHNAADKAWSVGIRHPRNEGQTIATLRVSGAAVCTSGDYERRDAGGGHHIIDPRTGASPTAVASVTTIHWSATVADALGTAAFVLGPDAGLRLFEENGVEGVIVRDTMDVVATAGMERYRAGGRDQT